MPSHQALREIAPLFHIFIRFQSMTGLECGHLYCTTCWTEYLTVKIMDEGASQSIQCPTGDCQMLVDDATVLRLVKDARVTLKYQHLITNSFVTVRLEYMCRVI